MSISILIQPGSTPTKPTVQGVGYEDLGMKLGAGGVIAGMDNMLKDTKQFDPYQWRWSADKGVPIAVARAVPGAATIKPVLTPEALTDHIWNNLRGVAPVTYHADLTREVVLTSTAEMTKSLTAGASITSSVEVTGGPVKASASATVSLSATVGKTDSHSRSVSLGTSDGAQTTLQPGEAELLVLVADVGYAHIVVPVEAVFVGIIEWKFLKDKVWKSLDVEILQERYGLLRPGEAADGSGWETTVDIKVGSVSAVDQETEPITSTNPDELQRARNAAVHTVGENGGLRLVTQL